MEGLISLFRVLLVPAHKLAELVGLPAHLPALELSVGLLFLTCCCGLTLLAVYHWLRSKQLILLIAAFVSLATGIIGLFATVTAQHAWLYALVLSIIAADAYWRITTKTELPRAMRRAGILWATAALILCAGTPTLYVVHTWMNGEKVQNQLSQSLTDEYEHIVTTEQARITASVSKLSEASELQAATLTVGEPLLVALVQRMSIEENVPYLVVLDSNSKVLARSQPVAAFGDTWPVQLPDVSTGSTSGIALSERGIPLILTARPIVSKTAPDLFILVGGIQIDQNYVSARSGELKKPLFFANSKGVMAVSAPEGRALNALSSQNIDGTIAGKAGGVFSFSLASGDARYLVQGRPLLGASGKSLGSLGTAAEDTSTGFRLRLDFVVIVGLAALTLILPAVLWRKREGKL